MNKIISCCGVVCSECNYFPNDCSGCPKIKGIAFWLQFTGESICATYHCCIEKKGLEHCGQCLELPCNLYYEGNDPTKTVEENENILKSQLNQLHNM